MNYEIWAPHASRMRLAIADENIEMNRCDGGWWRVDAPSGDYGFLIDESTQVLPDPRSRWQPYGVHEKSRPFDAEAFAWSDDGWRGAPIDGGVIYELHVGTFTPEGTFVAALQHLDHLKSVGVTHIELMPVNAFNGDHNWGYDGVAWYAVHEQYGGPEGYQRFVDVCHAAGLAVVQDVVYNHLGPSGNYLPQFGPYLDNSGRSSWGEHINLAEPEVREFILGNVEYWFAQMYVDALRLDAVHALHDDSDKHILQEMAERTALLEGRLGRRLELIAETDLNDPKLITPIGDGGYGLDAQWSDDFHHALHVALTGETDGYYADFAPLSALAIVLERGFFHAGTYSSFRGRVHGAPIDTGRTPSWRLVVSAQNHDQIGNRARGDRITEKLNESELLIAALMLYAGPFTPMLFMGEEWAAATPFQYFTSHPEPELAKAVAEGRMGEFARMGWDRSVVPDPQDPATFERSHLGWAELLDAPEVTEVHSPRDGVVVVGALGVGAVMGDGRAPQTGRHARVLAGYRTLAGLRESMPSLRSSAFAADVWVDDDRRLLRFTRTADCEAAQVVINFGTETWEVAIAPPATRVLGDPEPSGAELSGAALKFATDVGVRLDGCRVTLPPRTGALVTIANTAQNAY